jgi:hypothetical protein
MRSWRRLADSPGRLPRAVAAGSVVIGLLASGWHHPIIRTAGPELLRAAADPYRQARRALIAQIPADAPVAATFQVQPQLSNREHLSSLHYIYLGYDNYTREPYRPAVAPIYALIDTTDRVTFEGFFAPHGASNMRRMLHAGWGLEELVGPLMLWARGSRSGLVPIRQITQPIDGNRPAGRFAGDLELTSARGALEQGRFGPQVALRLVWRSTSFAKRKYLVGIRITGADGATLGTSAHDVGYELWPTSQWPAGGWIETFHRVLVPGARNAAPHTCRFMIWDAATGEPAPATAGQGAEVEVLEGMWLAIPLAPDGPHT